MRFHFLAVRSLLLILVIFPAVAAEAEMHWQFMPTANGGIRLEITFSGTTQPDPDENDIRNIELTLPGGTFVGGGNARSDFYFEDTLTSTITADSQAIDPAFVRIGNGVDSEQLFISMQPGIPAGSVVEMHIVAEWEPTNFAYSSLTPGTYAVARPAYGGATVVIAPEKGATSVPVSSPVGLAVLALVLAGLGCAALYRVRSGRLGA